MSQQSLHPLKIHLAPLQEAPCGPCTLTSVQCNAVDVVKYLPTCLVTPMILSHHRIKISIPPNSHGIHSRMFFHVIVATCFWWLKKWRLDGVIVWSALRVNIFHFVDKYWRNTKWRADVSFASAKEAACFAPKRSKQNMNMMGQLGMSQPQCHIIWKLIHCAVLGCCHHVWLPRCSGQVVHQGVCFMFFTCPTVLVVLWGCPGLHSGCVLKVHLELTLCHSCLNQKLITLLSPATKK